MDHIEGDRALNAGGADRLGFRQVARRVAAALADHASDGGLVVGLEGKWGSGKSSLLSLIEEELNERAPTERPTIIKFRPWLVGNRDSLLLRLFSEFSRGIDRFRAELGDTSGIDEKEIKDKGEPSLVQQKDRLWNDLAALRHRFVVTIDDVDRLEPIDLMEVMRLVRSAADFPNVVYVLCYDSEIVQLTVTVPKPKPFQLRNWFGEELARLSTPGSEAQV